MKTNESNRDPLPQKIAGIIIRFILRCVILITFRPKVIWASDEAKKAIHDQSAVIISNHIRGFDGAVIQTMLLRVKCYSLMAKDMEQKQPILKRILPYLRLKEIDRNQASLSWIRESRNILSGGSSIYMCPEGHCNFDKQMTEFKPGFILLAATADVPIIPICHNGEYHPFFGKRFRMYIGEPVSVLPKPQGIQADYMAEKSDEIRQTVKQFEQYVRR